MDSVDELVKLIINGVNEIRAAYVNEGMSLPSLSEKYAPSIVEGKTTQSVETVVAAAWELIATVRPAPTTVMEESLVAFNSAAICVAVQHNVTEILREAGPKGLHISEIGRKARTQPEKLGRILRYLAAHHIFAEVSPNVFANNRVSSVMDTGKSYEENFTNPGKKYENTDGVSALVQHWTDEAGKATAYIPDYFNSELVFSDEPNATPFSLAYSTTEPVFQWYAQPGREEMLARLGSAMNGSTRFFPPGLILERYSWSSLAEDSIVVDVGGGIGSSTLELAKQYPHLKFIVQDLPETVKNGDNYWQQEYPEAISSGHVKLQAHNFFNPQPIRNASVFVLRIVLHDWPTPYAKKILIQLRAAAQPSTKVVLVEQIVPYLSKEALPPSTCDTTNTKLPSISDPQAVHGAARAPFLLDLQMMNMNNGMERTLGDWVECVEGTGWKITEVKYGPLSSLILVPV
jgi:hypothetical protein